MNERLLNVDQVADRLDYSKSWLYHNWPKLKEEYQLHIVRFSRGKLKFFEREINQIMKANIVQ